MLHVFVLFCVRRIGWPRSCREGDLAGAGQWLNEAGVGAARGQNEHLRECRWRHRVIQIWGRHGCVRQAPGTTRPLRRIGLLSEWRDGHEVSPDLLREYNRLDAVGWILVLIELHVGR